MRWTKTRWLVLLAAALLAGLVMALGLAVQTQPLLAPQAAGIAPADVARVKRFLRINDPRRFPSGSLRTLRIDASEIELLLNQLLAWQAPGRPAAVRLLLSNGQAQLNGSLALGGPFWLNVQAELLAAGGLPTVERLRLGRLPVPAWLAGLGRELLLRQLGGREEVRLARELVRHVSVQPGYVLLIYQWQADSYRRVLSTLVPAALQQALRAQSDWLAHWSQQPNRAASASLAELLSEALQLAHKRAAAGGSLADERQAATLNLAFYVLGRRVADVLPDAKDWPQPRRLRVTLQGRDDFAQHFLVSAALAAAGGGPLADAIGVYKEQADAQHGSGFSFNDIAADRAGTRFGLLAVQRPDALQPRLSQPLSEADLLPDVADLPQFLSRREFAQRFGSIEAPAYREMMALIEDRLDRSPLLRR